MVALVCPFFLTVSSSRYGSVKAKVSVGFCNHVITCCEGGRFCIFSYGAAFETVRLLCFNLYISRRRMHRCTLVKKMTIDFVVVSREYGIYSSCNPYNAHSLQTTSKQTRDAHQQRYTPDPVTSSQARRGTQKWEFPEIRGPFLGGPHKKD